MEPATLICLGILGASLPLGALLGAQNDEPHYRRASMPGPEPERKKAPVYPKLRVRWWPGSDGSVWVDCGVGQPQRVTARELAMCRSEWQRDKLSYAETQEEQLAELTFLGVTSCYAFPGYSGARIEALREDLLHSRAPLRRDRSYTALLEGRDPLPEEERPSVS